MEQNTQEWHIAQWGTWGWIETVLKLIAIGTGLVAYVRSLSEGAFVIANNPHLAAIIIFTLITLGAILQLVTRFQQRETISMVFAALNLVGHAGMLIALLHDPSPRTLPIIFAVFYILGQLVKLQFLRVSGYTEGGADMRRMLLIAIAQAVIYLLFVILLFL